MTKLIASLLTLALLLTSCGHQPQLVLRDQENGQVYYSTPAADMTITVEWVHSIEHTPWKEIYVLEDGELYLSEVILESYGAGAPTDLPGITEAADGVIRTYGMHEKVESLKWVHSHATSHTLTIGETVISTDIPHQAFVELVVK